MARRSQDSSVVDASKAEMSFAERSALTNRVRLVELKLSEAEGAIKKDQKSVE